MSFRTNSSQQLSFTDSLTDLTDREKNVLEKSWAHVFAKDIFPAIDEDRFSVLYSDKASRPNTPINVIIGALIIKEMFGYSDDEVVENLMFNLQMQYALHTTSYEEQPLSDKTLSRFRKRCYDYERLNNVDLYHDCVKDLSDKIAKMMGINKHIRRMDSMMIESNIRTLSRTEIIYVCISKLVKKLIDLKVEIDNSLERYADSDDYNKTFYYTRGEELNEKISVMMKDVDTLLGIVANSYEDLTERELFIRCITEQTISDNGVRRLRTKEELEAGSGMLQSPADPDATFREKAGRKHRGYAANIVESVSDGKSVVTDYTFDTNVHSDREFIRTSLSEEEIHEEPVTIVADGAYYSTDIKDAARKKNIRVVNTDLVGKEVKDILADFTLSEDGKEVLSCPAGIEPLTNKYNSRNGQIRATFDSEHCRNCPHRDKCQAKIHPKISTVTISRKAVVKAEAQRFMKTDEFKSLARLRNGVETIPSILRRVYQVDRMPRGKINGKFFFGSKILALNIRKLLADVWGSGHYALNPIFR